MRWFARDGLWVCCAFVAMLVSSGCKREIAELAPTSPPTVTVSQPLEREISDEHNYTGHTDAIHAVDVHAKVSGFIDEVAFKDGDIVEKDATLFQIDPRPFDADVARDEAALLSAKARAKRAAADLARAKELIKGKNISQEQFDQTFADEAQAAAAVEQAKASLTTSKLNQDYAKITAAVGGRVSRAMITKGNFVFGGAGAATLLTTIVPLDPIYAYFDVDEAIYLRVAKRARDPNRPPPEVGMQLANESGFPHQGQIDFIDNKVDPATGTIRVRAQFPNADGVITPGLFVKIRVRSPEKRPALLIADRAVSMDQNRKYVLVVGADNKVEYREVITGPLVDGLRAVEKGLQSGDWVIVNGLQRARPGAPVNPQKESMPVPPDTEAQPEVETARRVRQASLRAPAHLGRRQALGIRLRAPQHGARPDA